MAANPKRVAPGAGSKEGGKGLELNRGPSLTKATSNP